jgi:hypothetical protein
VRLRYPRGVYDCGPFLVFMTHMHSKNPVTLLLPPPLPPPQRAHLLVWQRVNHFKHAKELTRKDLLKKNLARYQVSVGGELTLNKAAML